MSEISIEDFESDYDLQIELLVKENEQFREQVKILKAALEKAVKYIDLCPSDPDIYPDQLLAWNEYKQALKKIEEMSNED